MLKKNPFLLCCYLWPSNSLSCLFIFEFAFICLEHCWWERKSHVWILMTGLFGIPWNNWHGLLCDYRAYNCGEGAQVTVHTIFMDGVNVVIIPVLVLFSYIFDTWSICLCCNRTQGFLVYTLSLLVINDGKWYL